MRRGILIAHDTKKTDLVTWLRSKQEDLSSVGLFATRSTGRVIRAMTGIQVNILPDGPGPGRHPR